MRSMTKYNLISFIYYVLFSIASVFIFAVTTYFLTAHRVSTYAIYGILCTISILFYLIAGFTFKPTKSIIEDFFSFSLVSQIDVLIWCYCIYISPRNIDFMDVIGKVWNLFYFYNVTPGIISEFFLYPLPENKSLLPFIWLSQTIFPMILLFFGIELRRILNKKFPQLAEKNFSFIDGKKDHFSSIPNKFFKMLWPVSWLFIIFLVCMVVILINLRYITPPLLQEITIKKSTSSKDGMIMIFVPEGNFIMGATEIRGFAMPVHTVWLDSYWIDMTEVSNQMYKKCVENGVCDPSSCNADTNFNGDLQPVVCVDWINADKYCKWVGQRMPSEAEWEKAARGTNGWLYPWGNNLPEKDRLNYHNLIGKTTNIGNYPGGMSPYGALDMAGNVWEWVADWNGDQNSISNESVSVLRNPLGPSSGEYKVVRGGSWKNDDLQVESDYRSGEIPNGKDNFTGFRCAVPISTVDLK
jgi:formylglycine-generating enzyme required for sulfatase activity